MLLGPLLAPQAHQPKERGAPGTLDRLAQDYLSSSNKVLDQLSKEIEQALR